MPTPDDALAEFEIEGIAGCRQPWRGASCWMLRHLPTGLFWRGALGGGSCLGVIGAAFPERPTLADLGTGPLTLVVMDDARPRQEWFRQLPVVPAEWDIVEYREQPA